MTDRIFPPPAPPNPMPLPVPEIDHERARWQGRLVGVLVSAALWGLIFSCLHFAVNGTEIWALLVIGAIFSLVFSTSYI
ncbi:hypothetical protein [Pseudomonas fluorescens]|uniref:hypothetical protein n=1 Tax=Pseudomonas fluorescens TaxID=294 RepID=UPI0011465B51|nr:hypothetical protein [Pseudomonas fluorescens]